MSDAATHDDLSTWSDTLEAVAASLPEPRAINRVAVVRETGSTQDAARAMSGGRPGLLVVAGRQTAGRGRLGRAWADTPRHSLAMTLVLDTARFAGGQAALAAGVGACVAAERLGATRVGLKWPNDVVERGTGRKLAGVLVEKTDDLLLLGVGMNVSHAADDWPEAIRAHAVSLATLGVETTRLDTARHLLASLSESLALHQATLCSAWGRRDTLVGARHTFGHDSRVFTGVVESIDPASRIVIRTDAGVRELLPAATTTLLRPDDAQSG